MAEPFKMIRARQLRSDAVGHDGCGAGKVGVRKMAGICEKLLSVLVMPCKVKALVAGRKWTVPF